MTWADDMADAGRRAADRRRDVGPPDVTIEWTPVDRDRPLGPGESAVVAVGTVHLNATPEQLDVLGLPANASQDWVDRALGERLAEWVLRQRDGGGDDDG